MTIASVLVHVSDNHRSPVWTEFALRVAERHEAHLIGLFTMAPPQLPTQIMGYVPPELIQRYEQDIAEAAQNAKAAFEKTVDRAAVQTEWRQVGGHPRESLILHSRYSDLTIIGQFEGDSDPDSEGLADTLVLSAGGPVLIIPYAGNFNTVAETVMVAWNGTKEAARAVRDALPFMRAASNTYVVCVNAPNEDHIAGTDVATYLSRHGVTAEVRNVVAPEISIGDAILDAIADYSCDMLVMGGYGHSRLRELAFGGVTRLILGQMTVPALLSH